VTEHVVVLCTDVDQCGQSLAALPVRQGHREDAFLGPVRVCLGNVTTTYPWLATRAPPSGEMADASRGPMSTGGGHTKLESTIRLLPTGYRSISSGPRWAQMAVVGRTVPSNRPRPADRSWRSSGQIFRLLGPITSFATSSSAISNPQQPVPVSEARPRIRCGCRSGENLDGTARPQPNETRG
jgi:hypothetical protein